jgi:hypothetical protein
MATEDSMVRAHETEQHRSLIAGPDQPLFAIPMDDGTVRYFMSEEEAGRRNYRRNDR